jgi:hypothetical protein
LAPYQLVGIIQPVAPAPAKKALLRAACRNGIDAHAHTLVPYIAAARQRYSPAPVVAAIEHLRRYLQLLFAQAKPKTRHAR